MSYSGTPLELLSVYNTWEEFFNAVDEYTKRTYQPFVKASSKKVETHNRVLKGQKYPEDMVYQYYTYGCTHRGKFFTRGTGQKKTKSVKGGCKAKIHASLLKDRPGKIVVTSIIDKHNHPIGEHLFQSYVQNRALSEEEKTVAEKLCALNVPNPDLKKELKLLTGKEITDGDVRNVKSNYRRKEKLAVLENGEDHTYSQMLLRHIELIKMTDPSFSTDIEFKPPPSVLHKQQTQSKPMLFVAVHAGAGNHSKANEAQYKQVCKAACEQAMALLGTGAPALDAVVAAVKELEDNECTNAGYGSNLSMQGDVECEACAMDGASLQFGAVGVLSHVKNPISVASKLVTEQMKGPLPLGRIRPSILVGTGAQMFCCEHGIETNHFLKTDSTLRTYGRYKRKLDMAEEKSNRAKRARLEAASQENTHSQPTDNVSFVQDTVGAICVDEHGPDNDSFVQDTVGAICFDEHGNVAAGSSSGGIWLKHPGRIGPIAMYGTGCWAQNQTTETKPSVAAVTSGCGEHLMSTVLAKTLADGIRSPENLSQSLSETFQSSFLESELLARIPEKLGGALVLKTSKDKGDNEMEFCCIHSTSSMCFAFMTGNQQSPEVVMSRLEEHCVPGQTFTMGGYVLRA